MKLQQDWERHLRKWTAKLPELFYTPVGEITYQGFTTCKQLSLTCAEEEGIKNGLKPMPEGTVWGQLNEYAWMFGSVSLPESFSYPNETEKHPLAGHAIVMSLAPGGESTVYVNHEVFGTRRSEWVDVPHHYISDQILTKNAVSGAHFDLALEVLATTGAREGCILPVLKGEEPFPEDPTPFCKVGTSTFGIWNEDIYQLWIEVTALTEIAQNGTAGSSRTKKIYQGLREFTKTINFADGMTNLSESAKAAREILRPLMETQNSDSQATMYAFGHSHIDVCWFWPYTETMRKCARTFGGQMNHLNNYPEYVFLQSTPQLYQITKDLYPKLYEQIKEKAAEGRFIPEGGMWVEADTNLPSGESLIRQFIHGKRFFKEEFGKDNELLWLPDVFGYTAALPQIMKGCGIKYFSSSKLFWNYGGGEPFPYNYFRWIGLDGSEVTAFLHEDYNSRMNPKTMIQRWENRRQQDISINEFLVPFGYGDGGGGATRDHIEYALKEKNLEGVPKVKLASPLDFFHDLEQRGDTPVEEYVGELYFQCHRGTYTSQAETKLGNRLCELGLRNAEMLSSAAMEDTAYRYPYGDADAAWKKVLLNQFHDIIPGSSIAAVYKLTHQQHQEVLHTVSNMEELALSGLCKKDSSALNVFNSISWDREELIALPEGYKGLSCAAGSCPVQAIGTDTYALVSARELSFANYTLTKESGDFTENTAVTATTTLLENSKIKAVFNASGEIESLFHKESGIELAAGTLNSFHMYQDVPTDYDAWDLESFYSDYPVALDEKAHIEVIAGGALVGILKITRKLHDSVLTQYVSLRQDAMQLDFKTTVDWQEDQKLLKTNFPLNIYNNNAMHEIQFGYMERPTHRSTQLDKDRFEVVNHKWSALCDANHGAAILNNCKYGINVEKNSMNLTLLNACVAPDKKADRGIRHFTYSLYIWDGVFFNSQVEKAAYVLNCPLKVTTGSARSTHSLVLSGADNIVVDTIKPAEDQSGDIIIRLYECMKAATRTTVSVNLSSSEIYACNMLEKTEGAALSTTSRVTLDFKPFEIKTLRLLK